MSVESPESLPLPKLLADLIESGVWPRNGEEHRAQEIHPLVAPLSVQRIAPEDDQIIFKAPPFHTLAAMARNWPAYSQVSCALAQIDPERALVIGDFGLGSGSFIILDYRVNRSDPSVLRLCWNDWKGNSWVPCAASFPEFIEIVGPLTPQPAALAYSQKRRKFPVWILRWVLAMACFAGATAILLMCLSAKGSDNTIIISATQVRIFMILLFSPAMGFLLGLGIGLLIRRTIKSALIGFLVPAAIDAAIMFLLSFA
jgi:hypothetical protein